MSKIITDIKDLDLNGSYTYADYLLWQFSERLELIKGKIFKMSPAPNSFHQEILGNLHYEFRTIFHKNKCKVYLAPFDVRLINHQKSSADNEIKTIVQPDLCVVCNPSIVDQKNCLGAPNLIIEILSKSTSKKDLSIKFDLYEENGVQEYWIVNPEDKNVLIYVLKDGKYIGSRPFIVESEIQSPTFPELKFEVDKIFEV
jgi:Uma2 family endonuclease